MGTGNPMNRLITPALFITLLWPGFSLAQESVPPASTKGDTQANFSSVGQQLPALQSTSGRFSSIAPRGQIKCGNSGLEGRVVSDNLLHVDQFDCGTIRGGSGYSGCCSFINVAPADSANSAQMLPGRKVFVKGAVLSAREMHGGYAAYFVVVENAQITPVGTDVDPLYMNATYMVCQPPQLDGLSKRVGHAFCVQSDIVKNWNLLTPSLAAALRPPESPQTGPGAISCREDTAHTDADLPSPVACAFNNYWAWWDMKARSPQSTFTYKPPELATGPQTVR
jgi:hypothetical protein